MGPFGKAYEQSLRENQPATYRELQASGELASHLREVDSAAQAEFESTLIAMLKAHPAEGDYLERVQHTMAIAQQARELVMDGLLVPDGETVRARADGGYA